MTFCELTSGEGELTSGEMPSGEMILSEMTFGETPGNNFDTTYISGCLRSTAMSASSQLNLVLCITRSLQFPPELWNVKATTMANLERTNAFEGWNNTFAHLAGRSHPSIWTLPGPH